MPSKSNKKPKAKKPPPKMTVLSEKLGPEREESFLREDPLLKGGGKAPKGALVDMAPEEKLSGGSGRLDDNEWSQNQDAIVVPEDTSAEAAMADQDALTAPQPPAQLTLPLLSDSGTLFIQGVQHLTAQLVGTPECAPLLVRVNEWIDALGKIKKLITGDEDKVEGLKKLVIEQGQPWGEKGSKQLVLAGAIVKVKAVNWRPTNDPLDKLTITDLDAGKVESYLRSNVDPQKENVDKVLGCYMKATIKWSLTDLTPTQQTNLAKMLADPGEWGQGLRECLKETKYQMMAPTMENES